MPWVFNSFSLFNWAIISSLSSILFIVSLFILDIAFFIVPTNLSTVLLTTSTNIDDDASNIVTLENNNVSKDYLELLYAGTDKIYIPVDELVDVKAEISRLNKELEVTEKQFSQAMARLNNENFVSKAPQKVIDGARESAEKLKNKISKLKESIEELSK